MAVKTLANSGADYGSWSSYITYLKTLGTLAAEENGRITNAEFDGGDCQFSGAGITPTSSNRLVIECDTGAKFSGVPMRYVDGARTIFNAGTEQMYVNWDYVTVRDIAIRSTATNGAGVLRVGSSRTGVLGQNLIVESNTSDVVLYTAATSDNWENCYFIRTGATNQHGVSADNGTRTFKNCASIALNTPGAGQRAWTGAYATDNVVNCIAYGYPIDYRPAYDVAGSKNNATDLTSGGTSTAPATGAQYSLTSADFGSLTNGSHDLRIVSGSTKLKDLGAASGGTTTDIIGQSISNTTRDIGPFEYQAASSGLASNPILGGGAAALPLGGFVA